MTAVIVTGIFLGIIITALWLLKKQREDKTGFGGPYYIQAYDETEGKNKDSYEKDARTEEAHEDQYPDSEETPGRACESEKEEEKEMGENAVRNDEFVRVKDFIPDADIDLKYAGEDNFTGEVIYEFSEAWLRYGTVMKLIPVQETLKRQGYRIKIWDAFRPVEAQFRLWEVYPDDTFVANPVTGYSSHSRGNTLDVTLVTENGDYVEMPSGFDDFSDKAYRTYENSTEEGRKNSLLLEKLMEENGFIPYENEWWHFSDTEEYPVEKTFKPY